MKLKSPRSWWKWGAKILVILLAVILMGFSIIAASFLGVGIAVVDEWSQQWSQGKLIKDDVNTEIYDSSGQTLAILHAEKNRTPVAFDRIPDQVKNAFLAIEDVRFYEHQGIDFRSIARAALTDLRSGNYDQGASTITQQLVRIALLSPEKTLQRKVREMVIAQELERRFSKDEIFNMYLNRVYFGHGAYGIQAAAQIYFGKSVEGLNLSEAALLAGLPKNPNGFSPYRHQEKALERRNIVLAQMWRYGLISTTDYEQASAAPIALRGLPQDTYKYPYFVDYVIQYVVSHYAISEDTLYRGGFRVYTTLDPRIQQSLESTFTQASNFPPSAGQELVQGAMVIVDASNGAVKGMIGGRGQHVKRGYNRAVDLKRQPGSALKPVVVYAPALEAGYTPDYQINDEPIDIHGYRPQNNGGNYHGWVTMQTALKYSFNVSAVKLLNQIGVQRGMDFAQKLGIPLTPADKGLALALGGLTQGVAPLQMAEAYAVFANQGVYHEPNVVLKLTDYNGRVLAGKKLISQQVMSPTNAQRMTQMLEQVVAGGTGTAAQLPGKTVAGKTGTTQLPNLPTFQGVEGNKDAWFVGYTENLVGAVWIGYDQTDAQHYLQGVYGGTYPARIWRRVFKGIQP